jgi:nicotinate dehydrogenase subunit A
MAMETTRFRLRINGSEREVGADENVPLLDVLREACGLKGTRFGCGVGECGACHVLVDGVSTPACDTPAWTVQGKEIVTVEGLARNGRPGALQQAFLEEQAGQCGYCLSGILVGAKALLDRNPDPSREQIASALSWHLCRCGVHNRVLEAVSLAAKRLREGAPA